MKLRGKGTQAKSTENNLLQVAFLLWMSCPHAEGIGATKGDDDDLFRRFSDKENSRKSKYFMLHKPPVALVREQMFLHQLHSISDY